MDILVDVVPYAVGAGAIALSVFSYFKIGNKSVNTNIENETQQSGEGNISQAAGHDIVNIKIEHAAVPMEGKKMESRVNKDPTRILFIDDDTRFKIVTMLKKQGWVHTSIMKDLKNFEAPKFKEANVTFAKAFTKNSIPDAYEGYGYEKKCAEERVIFQNSKSYIVRLGWQIGNEYFGNNMLAYFEEQQNIKGYVAASKKWFPACSFVKDSVREIYRIVTKEDPGIFMIDSNDRFNFFEIAEILNKKNGKRWKIIEDNSFIFEQRMVDFNCRIIKFSEIFDKRQVGVKFLLRLKK